MLLKVNILLEDGTASRELINSSSREKFFGYGQVFARRADIHPLITPFPGLSGNRSHSALAGN